MAIRTPYAFVDPVQVSSSLPSLARTREIFPVKDATQTSAPSLRIRVGPMGTVVSARAEEFCGAQDFPTAARGPPRLRAVSTVRERNAAIWRRVTVPAGS